MNEIISTLQREVQRKLGRNLIRIQQCERKIKVLVSDHEIAGAVEELESVRKQQFDAVAKKTLGQVVGDLMGSYLVPKPADCADEFAQESVAEELDAPVFRFKSQIQMSNEQYEQTKQRLGEFVALRNQLAHHFLEDCDIWSEDGCRSAQCYLDDSYERINAVHSEIRAWCETYVEIRRRAAEAMDSDEFRDLLEHGILPGGESVIWQRATIVELLRNAEEKLSLNGWTNLHAAIRAITESHPDHTPKRYGCSSWPQLLQRSGAFAIRREREGLGGRLEKTWYQSRTDGSRG